MPASPADDPAVRWRAEWLLERGDPRARATGRSSGPTSSRPAGRSSSPTTATPTSTTPPRSCWRCAASADDAGRRAAARRRARRRAGPSACSRADGGWGAFDADNTRRLIEKLPFCDFGAVIDPPSADVTAHVVEMLAALGHGRRPAGPARRALAARRPGGGRLVVRPLGRQLRLRHRRGRPGPGRGRGRRPSAADPARRALAGASTRTPTAAGARICAPTPTPTGAAAASRPPSQTAWALLALLAADDRDSRRRSQRGVELAGATPSAATAAGTRSSTPAPASRATSTSTTRCTGWCSRSVRSAATCRRAGWTGMSRRLAARRHRAAQRVRRAGRAGAGRHGSSGAAWDPSGSREWLPRPRPRSRPSAVVVAGVAGGAGPVAAPGRRASWPARCATNTVASCCAPRRPLAAELRRMGLRVRTGPMVSCDHIVDGAGRARGWPPPARWPSTWSRPQSCGRCATRPVPIAVVRVDRRHRPVAGCPPGHRPGGRARAAHAAPRSVRRCGAGPSSPARGTVVLAAPRSFCAGVERAIDIVELALQRYPRPVYVRRQIVHNAHVVADLQRQGAVFVDELDEVPDGTTVVFSAHGVAPAVRAEAARRGLNVIDATCPLVAKVHTEARRFVARGDTVLFIGHDGHDETEGTARRGARPDHAGRRRRPRPSSSRPTTPSKVAFVDADDARGRGRGRDGRRAARAVPADRSRRRPTTSATRPPTASRRSARSPPSPTWCMVLGSAELVELAAAGRGRRAQRARRPTWSTTPREILPRMAGRRADRRHHGGGIGAAASGRRGHRHAARARPDRRRSNARCTEEDIRFTLPKEVALS